MKQLGTVQAIAWLAMTLGGCLAENVTDGPGEAPPADVQPPTLALGYWWRYEGSDGRTYTHRYDGRDVIAGIDSHRIQVELSAPDDNGQSNYTFWYASSNWGFMAYRAGQFYMERDCPGAAWFPLNETIENECDSTLYNNGAVMARYDEHTTKIPGGWEEVTTGAGLMQAYRMEFYDHTTNETANTWWYAPEIRYRAKMIVGGDQTVLTLSAWGDASTDTVA